MSEEMKDRLEKAKAEIGEPTKVEGVNSEKESPLLVEIVSENFGDVPENVLQDVKEVEMEEIWETTYTNDGVVRKLVKRPKQ